MSKKQILTQALHQVELDGLSKDDKKAIAAYETAIKSGLAIFKGNALIPNKKVPSDGIDKVIDELIAEDEKALMTEFKEGFRGLLQEKITLDNVIKEKRIAFNKGVVEAKKGFTSKANKVLAIVDGIQTLRENYVNALTEDTALSGVIDTTIEEED